MGADATPADSHKWIAGTPRPATFGRESQPTGGRGHDSRDSGDDRMREDDRPNAEVVRLTRVEIARSGEKSHFTANQKVLQDHPELAERYRHVPGVKEY
jgi:hypothetical protein